MKENKISIEIERSVSDVFLFTITPQNTPVWVESIVEEKTDEWPVKIGSIYKNVNRAGQWSEYIVKDIRENELFELVLSDFSYHVRYAYKELAPTTTRLEYFEWVDNGELEAPFEKSVLERLKQKIEDI